jgi:septal ring factor EnvC (AmiA/AmiB activator)
VRRQLESARGRASAARRREASLLGELETIDRTLARRRADLMRLDQRLARVEAELTSLAGRRGQVAEDTVSQQAALARRLGGLARLDASPAPPSWFVGPATLARRRAAADLLAVARDDLQRLARFEWTTERLLARQEAVALLGRELGEVRRAVAHERAQIAEQGERRRQLLASTREDRATHERLAAELDEAARRLERLVKTLQRRSQARRVVARPGAPAVPPPSGGGPLVAGQLPWPVEGRIVTDYGRQVHPRFGTETVRTGIEIAAPEGAPIRAVGAGMVLYRGWLRGYGNLLVLDHGAGYYTLYAHAADLAVVEGQLVRAGEAIGRVGETGSADGPRLYFELRHQGRPEDPQLWLRRRP